MDVISMILMLLVAVILSRVVISILPLPLPLVQIALGALLAGLTDLGISLDPDVFFLLFLPPLLFLDGWRIPKEGLLRDRRTIAALAFGLVVFTVLGVGLFIHWMIPAMPLAVAFALAAILSPTDPVAVSAIAPNVPMPKRLQHILDGEALLNDASGLVCMRFAVAAAMTGAFSLGDATMTFVWLVLGGVASGAGVATAVNSVKSALARRYGEETGPEILISLMIPFAAYILAEKIEASGILAAVAAGIVMSFHEQSGQAQVSTRMRRAVVWDTVLFTLNGVIFVLLGEQLPKIIDSAVKAVTEAGHHEPLWLLVYVLAINVALVVLRYLWVWVSFWLTLYREGGKKAQIPSWRLVGVTALAGVRGTVTLAGILTLPLLLPDGSAFPARDLAVFLAAGVIIGSLVLASIGMPVLMKGLTLPPEPLHEREEDAARRAGAEAAIRAVEAMQQKLGEAGGNAEIYTSAVARVMEIYRDRLARLSHYETSGDEKSKQFQQIERQLWLAGIAAERAEIVKRMRGRALPEEVGARLIREIDLVEARLNGSW
ncbi:Na+/H+ antiporter [Paracoccus cavernae]|uniref:Na+/H+ antiporter n=1 Tax=Paracoccus cavernae TaxID=1571207 RepID=UPI0035F32AD8